MVILMEDMALFTGEAFLAFPVLMDLTQLK